MRKFKEEYHHRRHEDKRKQNATLNREIKEIEKKNDML
jgi:hypothetical protein